MRATLAEMKDFKGWLVLAARFEHLFGPMVDDVLFHQALRKNIARKTAYCVRRSDGPPGAPLLGGLLFSAKPPRYRIGWLAVSQRCRRLGIGRRLVERALARVQPPAEVVVTTFGPGVVEGYPAREFWAHMGFLAAEAAPAGPNGQPLQNYRRLIGGFSGEAI